MKRTAITEEAQRSSHSRSAAQSSQRDRNATVASETHLRNSRGVSLLAALRVNSAVSHSYEHGPAHESKSIETASPKSAESMQPDAEPAPQIAVTIRRRPRILSLDHGLAMPDTALRALAIRSVAQTPRSSTNEFIDRATQHRSRWPSAQAEQEHVPARPIELTILGRHAAHPSTCQARDLHHDRLRNPRQDPRSHAENAMSLPQRANRNSLVVSSRSR